MDTSEQYIKMADTPKIQGQWKPTLSDIYHTPTTPDNPNETSINIATVKGYNYFGHTRSPNIWLPRQDQLQKMVGVTKAWQFLAWIKRISFEVANPPQVFLRFEQDWSMEQLWLAFVMKAKYNKVWDGEQWKQSG